MDKKRSILNVSVAIFFKLIMLAISILVRRFVIQYLGNGINGLNSLYLSIVGFLSVAELGIGSAISFCMYKPIVEKEYDKVVGLYNLYNKAYRVIGCIIFVSGIAVSFFLPILAKDYTSINENLYLTFAIMLVSVLLTYLFSAKISLINAYKDNYIVTTINSTGQIIQYGLQIIAVVLFRSFMAYLFARILAVLAQWAITDFVFNKKYSFVIHHEKVELDADTIGQVKKKIYAVFLHKIGSVLVNTADSLIISAFIGVVLLGKYSNYTTIVSAMMGLLQLFFTPLTSILGHTYVSNTREEMLKYHHFFHIVNYILGCLFFSGYYSCIDSVITICFGEGLLLPKSISTVITINYFIQFMRLSTTLFKDATGTFYNDRYKPIIEGVLNVVLSILFVQRFGIVGVIMATILTNLFICYIVEPFVLYKYGFQKKSKSFIFYNYFLISIFVVSLSFQKMLFLQIESPVISFLVNGLIAVAISFIPIGIACITCKDFREICNRLFRKLM